MTESDQQTRRSKRDFEVGVEDIGGEWDHIVVDARSVEDAYRKAETRARDRRGFDFPHAFQAFEVEKGITHDRN